MSDEQQERSYTIKAGQAEERVSKDGRRYIRIWWGEITILLYETQQANQWGHFTWDVVIAEKSKQRTQQPGGRAGYPSSQQRGPARPGPSTTQRAQAAAKRDAAKPAPEFDDDLPF